MSVLPDVMSEALDYNNIKRRAMASRSYRVRIAPSNKTSFSAGETIFLDLPSNLSGTFMDMTQTYIRFKVTYTNTSIGAGNAAQVLSLDKCGAYGFLQRVACITSGQQIFDLNNYNVLAAAFMDTDASNDWKANAGNVLVGTTAACPHGETFSVSNGTPVTRTYCLPFILNPFALQKKLVPLFSLDSLRFRITLDTFTNALIQKAVNAANSLSYQLTDVEMVSYFTELSPSAMAQLDSMTGGVYNLLCPSYSNTQAVMADNATVVNSVLGIAVSSLERIIVIHRPTPASTAIAASLGARITNGLQTAQFFINSEAFPQRNVSNDDMGAEVLAEYLIADHALSDFSRASCIQNFNVSTGVGLGRNVFDGVLYNVGNAGIANGGAFGSTRNAWNCTGSGEVVGLGDEAITTVGSFVLAIELETGCSAGRSDRLYSGISTISSVVQYKGTYDGTVSDPATIDFFAQFTVLLTLNMRQTGVWSITI